MLDTGVDADHPDLEASYAGGVDVVHVDHVPDDGHGHGTQVADTIAAADDDRGVVGVAPDVSLYGVKVLNDSGEGTPSDILAGIERALRGPDGVVGIVSAVADGSQFAAWLPAVRTSAPARLVALEGARKAPAAP